MLVYGRKRLFGRPELWKHLWLTHWAYGWHWQSAKWRRPQPLVRPGCVFRQLAVMLLSWQTQTPEGAPQLLAVGKAFTAEKCGAAARGMLLRVMRSKRVLAAAVVLSVLLWWAPR